MNILYYTSGITGSGHIVQGISILYGLKRNGIQCNFKILHNSAMGFLAERAGVSHQAIPFENENQLSPNHYSVSKLYQVIVSFKPDILLVDISWFMLHSFIDTLSCKKVFLARQLPERVFSVPLSDGMITFDPDHYDRVIQTEPYDAPIEMVQINPIVIRNREEILSGHEALRQLGIAKTGTDDSKPVCLFAFNGNPGDFQRIKKTYSYLEEEGYSMIYSTNYKGGLFPLVDYFNAVDLLICGAGYNSFWEAVYFEKEAIFVPVPTRFENQFQRVDEWNGDTFRENGADQLAEIIRKL